MATQAFLWARALPGAVPEPAQSRSRGQSRQFAEAVRRGTSAKLVKRSDQEVMYGRWGPMATRIVRQSELTSKCHVIAGKL